MTNVMIAGVGYPNLRDLSIGPVLVPELREMDWPAGVEVDDWSIGPIMVVHRLQDRPGYYDRIVFLTGVHRDCEPGTIRCYRWDKQLPSDPEIQERVAEAVTGVIDLDNLLIIAERLGMLPQDVVVVEIEPLDTNWGPGFSPPVEAALDRVKDTVRKAALHGVN